MRALSFPQKNRVASERPATTIADVCVLLASSNPDRVKRSILMASLDKMTCDLDELLEPYQIPLLTALILSDNYSAAQILIDCRVDVNRSSAQQMTPLFVAAARGVSMPRSHCLVLERN